MVPSCPPQCFNPLAVPFAFHKIVPQFDHPHPTSSFCMHVFCGPFFLQIIKGKNTLGRGKLFIGPSSQITTLSHQSWSDGASWLESCRMTGCEAFSKSLGSLKRLCEEGHLHDALHIVDHMDQQVSSEIFYLLIEWCIKYKDLSAGRKLHRLIINSGLETDVFLGNNLIRMFGLCGSLPEVNQAFSRLHKTNALTWSATIAAYANLGQIDQAIQLCDHIQLSSINASDYVLTTLLKACGNGPALRQGKLVHDFAVKTGLECMVVVANALIDMYFKCGSSGDARKVFNKLPNRDVVTWTATIVGYVQLRNGTEAIQLFQQMGGAGIEPNRVTYTSILRACASMGALYQGMLMHAQIIEIGFEQVVVVCNTLIDMYAKCGSLKDGLTVFESLTNKNIVSWTVIIESYIYQTQSTEALLLFEQMLKGGWKPDNVLFLTVLKACTGIVSLDWLKLLHSYAMEDGFESDMNVGSSLVNMYVSHGSFEDAYRMFSNLPLRSVVTCTAIIAGLVEDGCSQEALQLFWSMQQEGMEPDAISFISILKACPTAAAIDQGRCIHTQVIEAGLESDVKVGSALVDFYSKIRDLKDARKVLDVLLNPDAVTWTAMIAGYVEEREYKSALLCFKDMQKGGFEPDDVTCICVLSACSHMGLVDEGCRHFMLMRENYGITPAFDHYDCMSSLLGHAGHLTLAEALLRTMPFGNNNASWISLLGHCSSYGNVELGKQCFDRAAAMSSGDAATYVLMSNLCADLGMLDHAAEVGGLKKGIEIWKKPGRAFIEVDKHPHDFIVGDKSHPQSDAIYAKLKALSEQLLDGGHVPQVGFVSDSV